MEMGKPKQPWNCIYTFISYRLRRYLEQNSPTTLQAHENLISILKAAMVSSCMYNIRHNTNFIMEIVWVEICLENDL